MDSTSCFPLTKLTVSGRLIGEASRGSTSPLPWTASLVNCERSLIWGNWDWEPVMPFIGSFKMSRMRSTGINEKWTKCEIHRCQIENTDKEEIK